MLSRNTQEFPPTTPVLPSDDLSLLSTIEMVDQPDQIRPERMRWWYRIAAPPVPEATASLQQREIYRRGKLISVALLMLLVIWWWSC